MAEVSTGPSNPNLHPNPNRNPTPTPNPNPNPSPTPNPNQVSTGLGKAMVGLLEHENPASVAGLERAFQGEALRKAENVIGGIDATVAA